MTYTPDLEPYDYYPGGPKGLAVGWLDSGAPFTTGECPRDVHRRLAEFAEHPVRLMRGYHYCQFCDVAPRTLLYGDLNIYEAPDVARGSGEIWIASPNGTNFAAPVMLPHYIDSHSYLPPSIFIDAVRLGDLVPGFAD